MSATQSGDNGEGNLVKKFTGDFMDYTTAHGLGRLHASPGRGKLFWSIFIIGTYIGFTVHFATLVDRFIAEPLITNYDPQLKYKFPDIYICPKNAISLSRLVNPISQSFIKLIQRKDSSLLLPLMLFGKNSNETVKRMFQFDTHDKKSTHLTKEAADLSDIIVHIQNSMLPEFLMRMSDITKCRVTVNGLEYQGSQNYVKTMKNPGGNNNNNPGTWYTPAELPTNFTCISFREAYNQLLLIDEWTAKLINMSIPNLDDNKCQSIYSLNIKKLLQYVSDLQVPTLNNIKYNSGPFCFFYYPGPNNTKELKASACGIPFCPLPKQYDCISKIDDITSNEYYTGKRSITQSGEECQSWNSVKETLYDDIDSGYEHRNTNFEIKRLYTMLVGPDKNEQDLQNYCRIIDYYTYRQINLKVKLNENDTHTDTVFDWVPYLSHVTDKKVPMCPVKSNYVSDKKLNFESCSIPECTSTISTLSGIIHDAIGKEILLQLFGNDLFLNLIQCQLGNQLCSKKDFETFMHPTMGTCYRFQHDKYTANKSYTELADMTLDLKLFNDFADSNGRTFNNLTVLESVANFQPVRKSLEVAGYNLFIQPTDEFPHSELAIPVTTGLRTEIQLKYQKDEKYDNGQCISEKNLPVVKYKWKAWESKINDKKGYDESVNDDIKNIIEQPGPPPFPEELTKGVFFEQTSEEQKWKKMLYNLKSNWTSNITEESKFSTLFNKTEETFRYTVYDCINQYKLDAFWKECNCVPSFLPVPSDYQNNKYTYCFEDIDYNITVMQNREHCFNKMVAKLSELTQIANDECPKPCVVQFYTEQKVTTIWPETHFEGIVKTLKYITEQFGIPQYIPRWKGMLSIYYTFLYGEFLQGKDARYVEEHVQFNLMSQAAKSSLSWVSIGAKSQYGFLTKQELAYPLKNLFADFGGLLGLWSGISVLTVCEIIELLVFIGMACRRRIHTNPNMKNQILDDNNMYKL